MNNTIILHHYELSPYAEKIRLMFGLANSNWQSLLSPDKPPRPNLDPLTGGYRRIPVAQLGADIFCDTALIAREVATITHCDELDPRNADARAAELMAKAEKEVFFASVTAIPPLRLLGTLVKMFGPLETYRFAKDRASLMKGGSVRPPQGQSAKDTFASFLETLEQTLGERQWLGGDAPSAADFASYHPLWLHVTLGRRPLACGPKVRDWYERVADMGYGSREEIDQAQAFASAREAEPRPVPDSVDNPPVALGEQVDVGPADYGTIPVRGSLAAVTDDRIIVARSTADFGTLHVHFPRAGYSLKAAN